MSKKKFKLYFKVQRLKIDARQMEEKHDTNKLKNLNNSMHLTSSVLEPPC